MSKLENYKGQGIRIVQVSRECHAYGGVPGVVQRLQASFTQLGVDNEVRAFRSSPNKDSSGRIFKKLKTLFDVVVFSFSGTISLALRNRNPNIVTIVHGDALGGDIYVDHGLHKAVIKGRPILLILNPIHLFIFLREEIRHNFNLYRKIAVLSRFSNSAINKNYPRISGDKFRYVGNGVDVNSFTINENRKFKNDNLLKLIFVGHEFDRKGLRVTLEAMSILPKLVSLTVVGGARDDIARYQAVARELDVQDRVRFLGVRRDVPDLLPDHDAFIMPSTFESSSLAVLEAMAAGLAVISTACGAAEELVREGGAGVIVERSGKDIAKHINAFIAAPQTLANMGSTARIVAEENSWLRVAERYIQIAKDLVEERRQS